MWKILILRGIVLFLPIVVWAGGGKQDSVSGYSINPASTWISGKKEISDCLFYGADSSSYWRKFIHQLGVEARPGYIVPTNVFLRRENSRGKPIRSSLAVHLKYSFQFRQNTYTDRIYGGAYQGIGVAFYNFGERAEVGNPVAFYLLQGARIARFAPWVSLNYEWNFGLSSGWKPYHYLYNTYNRMIGSKMNAYLNTNFYLNWTIARHLDLISGVALTHFSNGNTRFPNAGLNTVGFKLGMVYNFNRRERGFSEAAYKGAIPPFPRHISYDVVLFGSWRRKGVSFGGEQLASPDAYMVMGFNFNPMYNVSYKFKAGLSLDGVYDGSANVYTRDYIVGIRPEFFKPSLSQQLALGLSARAEYVMPYFTLAFGTGLNLLHRGGDLKAFYQMLALKIEVTRNSFIHIGYNLKDFQDPNFLMLGVGFRFNNKYPVFRR